MTKITSVTTLNPRFDLAIVVISLFGIADEFSSRYPVLFAFFLGAIVTLPLIAMIWKTMKKNWPVYRRFYSLPFRKRDMKTVRKSWRLTWWIVPYTIIVYSVVDLLILMNPQLGRPYSMIYGAVFTVFAYSAIQGSKYYHSVKRHR